MTDQATTSGRAANGMTYHGRTIGSGYDCTVIRESDDIAIVNLMTPNGQSDYLMEIEIGSETDLQRKAEHIASQGPIDGEWITPDDDAWDDIAARWDRLMESR